jgi:surface protein
MKIKFLIGGFLKEKNKIIVNTKHELNQLLWQEFKKNGFNCDLNHIDVSKLDDLSDLFNNYPQFNGDVSKWNVSNVKNMIGIFRSTQFNGDISKWDTSNVQNMSSMFERSKFNGDISKWNTSNVQNMNNLFFNSDFNGDVSKWDTSNVLCMAGLFRHTLFNSDISNWNVSNVRNMAYLFCHSKFNGDISKWDVSHVEDMRNIFNSSEFNGNLSNWKPYSLKFIDDSFTNFFSEIPYWANYEDKDERNKIINIFNFNKELYENLTLNSSLKKKMKI